MRRGMLLMVLLLNGCSGDGTGPGGEGTDQGQILFVRRALTPTGYDGTRTFYKANATSLDAVPLTGAATFEPNRPVFSQNGRFVAWSDSEFQVLVADLSTVASEGDTSGTGRFLAVVFARWITIDAGTKQSACDRHASRHRTE